MVLIIKQSTMLCNLLLLLPIVVIWVSDTFGGFGSSILSECFFFLYNCYSCY